MIRIFLNELRKIWGSRFFSIALCLLLITNLFLLWFNTRPSENEAPASAYKALGAVIKDMGRDEISIFLQEEQNRTTSYVHIDNILRNEALNGQQDIEARERFKTDFDRYYAAYMEGGYLVYGESLAQEYQFVTTMAVENTTVIEYEAFLDSIQDKAGQLSAVSIFADKQNGFEYKNILATAVDFATMYGTETEFYPQKGLMTAIGFQLTDLITVFAMLLVATVSVRIERDNGLLYLIRTTANGRRKTSVAKLLACGVSLGIILLLLYGMNLLYCAGVYGIGPLTRTIQSVPGLMRSTFKLTVGHYILYFLLTKWFAAFICGSWVMFAMLIAKRMLPGIVLSIGLIGANLFIRIVIPATSYLNAFKYANMVSLLQTNELIGGYRNLYVFGWPVSVLKIEVLSGAVLFSLFTISFCNRFTRQYFVPGKRTQRKRAKQWFASRYNSILQVELYKLLFMQGILFLLFAFTGFQVYTALTTHSYTSVQDIYYSHYLKPVEGAMTDEKYEWLEEQGKEFQPIYQAEYDYNNGVLSQAQYDAAMAQYRSIFIKQEVFEKVVDEVQRLNEKPRKQLVYENGWLKVFDAADESDLTDSVLLALLCTVCFSGIFAVEKQTGMIIIISVTPKGKRHTVKQKLLMVSYVSLFLTVISLLPRFWIAARDFGLGAWLAPLYSIDEWANAPELPLFIIVLLLILARFVSIMLIAHVTIFFSETIGNTFGAMFLSMFLFVLPPTLSLAGLTNAKWASVYTMLHIAGLFQYPYSYWICCCFILFSLACVYVIQHYLYTSFGRNKT